MNPQIYPINKVWFSKRASNTFSKIYLDVDPSFEVLSKRCPYHYAILENGVGAISLRPNEITISDFHSILPFNVLSKIESQDDLLCIYNLCTSKDKDSIGLGIKLLVQIAGKYKKFVNLTFLIRTDMYYVSSSDTFSKYLMYLINFRNYCNIRSLVDNSYYNDYEKAAVEKILEIEKIEKIEKIKRKEIKNKKIEEEYGYS